MARGFPPSASGHRSAALGAAERPLALALALTMLAPGLALGQAGPGAGVTVTAPSRIGGRAEPCATRSGQPASSDACAAAQLDRAAKGAEASAQGAPGLAVPDVRSPSAAIGLGTPAAAAQQPGTPYGKPPGYVPPPPPAASSGAGPFTRVHP